MKRNFTENEHSGNFRVKLFIYDVIALINFRKQTRNHYRQQAKSKVFGQCPNAYAQECFIRLPKDDDIVGNQYSVFKMNFWVIVNR